MEPLNLLLVGCGGMGARHVRGMAELERAAPGTLRLGAVCDVREESARKVAREAEELLGARPRVFTGVQEALAAARSLEAADVVTDPRSHDALVVSLLEAGLSVLCEKPLALTVQRGRRMVEAAERTGRVLATAENNRRDPMNRLTRACLDAGLIGAPNFALQLQVSPGAGIIATAWRHRRAMGGVLLDVAIHVGYILDYLLGPIETVCARAQLTQALRHGRDVYGNEVQVEVDAEDCFSANLRFAGGTQGHWTSHFGSMGETLFRRLIVGAEGTLDAPADRSGRSPQVRRGGEMLTGEALVAHLPDYHLNEIETRLFGERPACYALAGPVLDRKLQAAQMHDFVHAVRTGRQPEADGVVGLRSIANIYAALESAHCGRTVTLAQVLDGRLHAYQDTVEASALEE